MKVRVFFKPDQNYYHNNNLGPEMYSVHSRLDSMRESRISQQIFA